MPGDLNHLVDTYLDGCQPAAVTASIGSPHEPKKLANYHKMSGAICQTNNCPLTLTYLFRQTRHVPAVFVWDLLRLVDAVHGFAASVDAAVGKFKDGGCFAALAVFGGG